jgi:hypothetical protein
MRTQLSVQIELVMCTYHNGRPVNPWVYLPGSQVAHMIVLSPAAYLPVTCSHYIQMRSFIERIKRKEH